MCDKLSKAGFYENPKQNMFFAEKLKILGHIIDEDGLHPAAEMIHSIMDWTRPKNQKDVQRFNGMVNYISQFLSPAATITALLTELTGNAEWQWRYIQHAAVEAVKRAA